MEGELVAYDAQNIAALDRAARNVGIEMRRLGVDDILQQQTYALNDVLDEIQQEFADAGLPQPFSGPTEQVVQHLMSTATDQLAQEFDAGARTVQRYISSAVTGGIKRQELVDRLAQALDATAARAKTAMDTALHSFHRSVTVTHAKDVGIEEFAYLGPMDAKTREWCAHWVDRRATAAEFEATSSQWGHDTQPVPVMVWGGGWNCRHRFVPVLNPQNYKKGPR